MASPFSNNDYKPNISNKASPFSGGDEFDYPRMTQNMNPSPLSGGNNPYNNNQAG